MSRARKLFNSVNWLASATVAEQAKAIRTENFCYLLKVKAATQVDSVSKQAKRPEAIAVKATRKAKAQKQKQAATTSTDVVH